MPEPIIELDDPDESDGQEFPDIPDWKFDSRIHSASVTIEFSPDGEAYLTAIAGDPDDGPYQRFSFEIDYDDLVRLAREHIMPVADWIDRERARDREEAAQAAIRARAAADARPWFVKTGFTSGSTAQVSVHRSECGVVKSSGATRRGEHTFGGTHGGQEMIQELRQVEGTLKELISPRLVGAKQNAQRRAVAGHVRGTNLDRRPLVLCRRCNPLGDDTRDLQDEIERLAGVTEVIPTHEADVLTLMETLRTRVWEEEQAHLDRYIRGTDSQEKNFR